MVHPPLTVEKVLWWMSVLNLVLGKQTSIAEGRTLAFGYNSLLRFIFYRPGNGILSICRAAAAVVTVTAAGCRCCGRRGWRFKDRVGDSGIDWSGDGCWLGAGDEEGDLPNQPVRAGGLELGTRAGR